MLKFLIPLLLLSSVADAEEWTSAQKNGWVTHCINRPTVIPKRFLPAICSCTFDKMAKAVRPDAILSPRAFDLIIRDSVIECLKVLPYK